MNYTIEQQQATRRGSWEVSGLLGLLGDCICSVQPTCHLGVLGLSAGYVPARRCPPSIWLWFLPFTSGFNVLIAVPSTQLSVWLLALHGVVSAPLDNMVTVSVPSVS